jgi:hypothetical protein
VRKRGKEGSLPQFAAFASFIAKGWPMLVVFLLYAAHNNTGQNPTMYGLKPSRPTPQKFIKSHDPAKHIECAMAA